MAQKTKSKNLKIYIIASIATLIVAVLVFFSIKTAYDSGVADGRKNYEKETAELLSTLGTAISEKTEFNQNLGKVLSDVPSNIDSDSLDVYIKNLLNLNNSVHTEAAKNVLSSYIEKWQNFKDIYNSEDNDAITSAFNELKAEALTASTQIRKAYDDQIISALESLGSN